MDLTKTRWIPLLLAVAAVLGLFGAFAPVSAAAETGAFRYADDAFISAYAKKAVEQCRDYNVMHGSVTGGQHLFRPLDYITRQEMFRVVYSLNNAGKAEKNAMFERIAKTAAFEDKAAIAPWALSYAGYCISTGLFIGDAANRLNPTANITYFECAIVFLRLLGYTQDTLAVLKGETAAQWRQRITALADSRGLFDDVLYYANERYDQMIYRQDVAVMAANTMRCKTVTYYPVQNEGVYIEGQQTMAERSFGAVAEASAVITGMTETGYLLSDGAAVTAPDFRAPDRNCLGRKAVYLSSENNAVLSWDGAFAGGETVTTVPPAEVTLDLSAGGGVMIRLGSRALIYTADEEDIVYTFEANAGSAVAVGYDMLRVSLERYKSMAFPVIHRAVISENGKLQSLVVLRV